ncbi:MAG: hypothetical protein U1E76_00990 [Planctomycetota bacterium]
MPNSIGPEKNVLMREASSAVGEHRHLRRRLAGDGQPISFFWIGRITEPR